MGGPWAAEMTKQVMEVPRGLDCSIRAREEGDSGWADAAGRSIIGASTERE